MKQKSAEVASLDYLYEPCPDAETRLSCALDIITRLIIADLDPPPEPAIHDEAEPVP